MKSALLLTGWALIGMGAQAANDIEPLDADFLDYLVKTASDGGNWTLLGDAEHKQVRKSVANEVPAHKPAARKVTEEAAKAAVEER